MAIDLDLVETHESRQRGLESHQRVSSSGLSHPLFWFGVAAMPIYILILIHSGVAGSRPRVFIVSAIPLALFTVVAVIGAFLDPDRRGFRYVAGVVLLVLGVAGAMGDTLYVLASPS